MTCVNKAIPQFREAISEIGERKTSYILDRYFPDSIPSLDDIMSYVEPEALAQTYDKLGQERLKEMVKKLGNRFNLNYRLDGSIPELARIEKDGKIVINPNLAERDTAFHEFAHPLVEMVRQEYPKAYAAILKEARQDSKLVSFVERHYGKDYNQKHKDIEIVTTALGKAATLNKETKATKTIWEKINEILAKIFRLDSPPTFNGNTTLRDLVQVLTGDAKLDLSQYARVENQRASEFSNSYSGATNAQKRALDELRPIMDAGIYLDEKNNVYKSTLYPDFEGTRVGDVLNQRKDFKFEGESEIRTLSTDWGNMVDQITGDFLTGKDEVDILKDVQSLVREGKITDEAIEDYLEQLKIFKEARPGSIFIQQVKPFNLAKGYAGASDLIEITPKGKRILYDTKSSKYTTNGKYNYTGANGKEYERSYETSFNKSEGKLSMKQKHEAQVSFYKGLYLSKGFKIDHMGIIPAFLSNIEGDTVTSIELESIIVTQDLKLPGVPYRNDLKEAISNVIQGANDAKIADEDQIHATEDQKARLLHDKVMQLLEAEIKTLQSEGGTYSSYRVKKLEELETQIKTIESLQALDQFVEEMYTMFVGIEKDGKKIPSNFQRDATKVITTYKLGQYEDIQAINELKGISQHIESYRDTINSLRDFYIKHSKSNTIEKGSPLYKVKEIIDTFDIIDTKIGDEINPLLAKILGKMENLDVEKIIQPKIESYKKTHAKEIRAFDLKYNQLLIRSRTDEEIKKVEEDKLKAKEKIDNKLKASIENLTQDLATEDNLLSLLEVGYVDINAVDAWASPISNISNPILNSFQKLIKRKLANKRSLMQKWGLQAIKLINKSSSKTGWMNSGQDVNEEFLREVNGALYMATEVNYAKYKAAMKEAFDKIDNAGYSASYVYTQKRNWLLRNTKEVGEKDKIIKNPYTGEELVVEKGIQTIINEKKEELRLEFGEGTKNYTKAYNLWFAENTDGTGENLQYTGREFRKPSDEYIDKAFQKTISNPLKKEYYEFAAWSLAKANLKYPGGRNSLTVFKMPSIHKATTDRIKENGIKDYLQYSYNKTFGAVKEEDVEIYGIDALRPGSKIVPKMYQSGIPLKEVSRDMMSSIAVYLMAAERYEVQKSMETVSNATLDAVKIESIEKKSDGLRKELDPKDKLGLTIDKFKKKDGQSNLGKALEAFINAEIYGIREQKVTTTRMGKTYDWNKITNFFMKIMSMTSIAGAPLVAAANYLQQNVVLAMEAVAGEYISAGSYARARAKYNSFQADFLKDMAQGYNSSLIGQLVDLYDPQMDNFTDHFGRQISGSVGKRLMQTSSLFHMMRKSDHQIYVTSMLAVLMDTKVLDKNGKEIDLLDAYVLNKDNGQIELIEGVNLDEESNIDFASKEKMDAMNQRLHGVYNSFDKPMMERYAAGNLVAMFRKFVVPGFKKRFKPVGIDHNLGAVTEGFYKTFGRLLIQETTELKNWLLFNENSLTSEEKANAKRFLFEATAMILLGIIIAGLSAAVDDDEDKKGLNYPLYLAYRLRSELMFYANPFDFMRVLRTPTVSYTVVERVMKFLWQLLNPFEEYKVGTSVFEKGTNKLYARTLNLWGYNGSTANPDMALKNLKRYSEGN